MTYWYLSSKSIDGYAGGILAGHVELAVAVEVEVGCVLDHVEAALARLL